MDRIEELFKKWEEDDPGSTDVDVPPETPQYFDEIDATTPDRVPDVESAESFADNEAAEGEPETAHTDSETATRPPMPAPANRLHSPAAVSVPSSAASPAGIGKKSNAPDWKELGDRLQAATLANSTSHTFDPIFANAGSTGAYRMTQDNDAERAQLARQPLELAKARQDYESKDIDMEGKRRKAGVDDAMRDPNSLQSQKARESIKAFFGDQPLPRGFDGWSAADVQQFANSGTLEKLADNRRAAGDKAAKAAADQAKLAESKTKEGRAAAETEALRREVAKIAPNADLTGLSATDLRAIRSAKDAETRARIMAAAQREKEKDKNNQDVPPGHEIEPGANPGPDSRKKYTALVASQQKLRGLTKKMREETAGIGRAGRILNYSRLNQLATQIGIEGKNVADLGALSGPDMDLMKAMVQNPTDAWNIFRDSDIASNMDGLDSWADESVKAGEKAYGIHKTATDPETPPIPADSPKKKLTPKGKPYARKQQDTETGAVRYLDEGGKVVE